MNKFYNIFYKILSEIFPKKLNVSCKCIHAPVIDRLNLI